MLAKSLISITRIKLKFFLIFNFFIIMLILKNDLFYKIYIVFNKFFQLSRKKILTKKLKICLCVIGKNENFYAQEYIEYYKKLGYNKIFIYDNNNIDGERFEDVIKKYIQQGFVSIINFRGYRGIPQLPSYKDCYEKNNLQYDWLSFFDMDEYLELRPKNITIQKFLSKEVFKKCKNIKINWIIYQNNNILYREDKPLNERRFEMKIPNKHIKSTVRGNLTKNYWINALNPHSSLNITSCSGSGKIINSDSPFNNPPDISQAFIKHYQIKSFEELCLKLKRGRADTIVNLTERIKKFYEQNKNCTEKMKIMKKIFNIT